MPNQPAQVVPVRGHHIPALQAGNQTFKPIATYKVDLMAHAGVFRCRTLRKCPTPGRDAKSCGNGIKFILGKWKTGHINRLRSIIFIFVIVIKILDDIDDQSAVFFNSLTSVASDLFQAFQVAAFELHHL